MRITAFRIWFGSAVQQGIGAARRAGFAIARKLRPSAGKIDEGAGVGDDESSFGGRGSRAWIEIVEEIKKKVEELFGRSTFERFPRFEKLLRRFFGLPKKEHNAPRLEAPKKSAAENPASSFDLREAERVRAQIRMAVLDAHTKERAGRLDQTASAKSDAATSQAGTRARTKKDE
jgi:hypothetical protein